MAELEGEHDWSAGPVALLFTDIEGSSGHWERDAAAMRSALSLHDRVVKSTITEHGGRIFSTGGDGFGCAFTTLDAAITAAEQAQYRLATAPWPDAMALRVRMGVHSGRPEVVDGTLQGPPVNRAARIMDAGHGGQILVSGPVAAHLDANRCRDLGEFELRGLGDPERLAELRTDLTAESSHPPPRTRRVGPRSPVPFPTRLGFDRDVEFTGRADDLDRFDREIWPVAAGAGAPLVLVAGEAGIGKTRFCAEIARRAFDHGGAVLYGRCVEAAGRPYEPIADALRPVVAVDRAGAPSLAEAISRHRGVLARVLPELGDGSVEPAEQVAPERITHAVTDILVALADRVTAVLVIADDIQWADEATLRLLDHLANRIGPERVGFVIAYRDTDVDRDGSVAAFLAQCRRQPSTRSIGLGGLPLAELERFVERAAGHDLDGPLRELVAELYDDTGGNPFFVGELIRHFLATGALRHDGERWDLADQRGSAGIPQGITELVRQRLRALDPATSGLLVTAAVIGDHFDDSTLAAAHETSVDHVVRSLEPATAAGLVADEDGAHRFAHALVRAAIRDDLPRATRLAQHERIARAIESTDRRGRRWSELAHHWNEAASLGHTNEAITALRRAGDAAADSTAYAAAVDYRRAALAIGEADTQRSDDERTELVLDLADAMTTAGDLDVAAGHYLDAAAEAERLGRSDLLARAALGHGGDLPATPPADPAAIELVQRTLDQHPIRDATRALLLSRLAERRHRVASRTERAQTSDEAVQIADELDDAALRARVMLSRSRALHGPDAIDEMRAIARRVEDLATELADDALTSRAAQVRMHASFVTDAIDDAADAARLAALMARRLRQPEFERIPLMWDAFLAMLHGEFARGERLVSELGDLLASGHHSQRSALTGALVMTDMIFRGRAAGAYEIMQSIDVPYAEALLAWFAAEAGLLNEASDHLDRLGPLARVDEDHNWSWWQAMASVVAASSLLGDGARAGEAMSLIEPWADQHALAGVVSFLGTGRHHLGVAARTAGDVDAAVANLELAVERHDRLGARPYAALTRAELARALDERSAPADAETARRHRADAAAMSRELGLVAVDARL